MLPTSQFIIIWLLLGLQPVGAMMTKIICSYDKFASVQQVENVIETLQLTFMVDKDTSDAQVVRNDAIRNVELYPTGGGFTFIEITKSGNILTTTVDIHGKSAHSRNTILDGKLVPSQFYGSCDYE